MTRNLNGLFDPKSVAIVGASDNVQKVGAVTLQNLIISDYKGVIYPVNKNLTNVGAMKFYDDVQNIGTVPELVVIAIPANGVLDEVEKCGKLGVKNIIIFSAGFKEVGGNGIELENRLKILADKYELNILGPNCMGIASTSIPLNLTFGTPLKSKGNLRLISQSGALASAIFDWGSEVGIGFDEFVSIGNKTVLDENDILEYWLDKGNNNEGVISPIGIYVESITEGKKLANTIRKISPTCPVFILKPGKSIASQAAMQSHTGAIAGEDRVVSSVLKESGAIRCQSLANFFELTMGFAANKVPLGPDVAIITNAGGLGVMATDVVDDSGLKMAILHQSTIDKLAKVLPPMASVLNPVDILGDALADRFAKTMECILEDDQIKSVVVLITPQEMTELEKTAAIIGDMAKKYPQPIICAMTGGQKIKNAKEILKKQNVPNFQFPEMAIKTLGLMWQWQKWRNELTVEHQKVSEIENKEKIKNLLDAAVEQGMSTLNNNQADELLGLVNVLTPDTEIVKNIEEALNFGNKNWPVVLKISASGLLHKSDIGGVVTNINTKDELVLAFNKLNSEISKLKEGNLKQIEIQIQKQIDSGIEVILGVKRDKNFGAVMMFGAGGKMAQLLDDYNLATIPLSLESAKRLVENSKVAKLLSGFRGEKEFKLDQLYEIMIIMGQLIMDYPEIEEIEINPLLMTHRGIWALDPKIILTKRNAMAL